MTTPEAKAEISIGDGNTHTLAVSTSNTVVFTGFGDSPGTLILDQGCRTYWSDNSLSLEGRNISA